MSALIFHLWVFVSLLLKFFLGMANFVEWSLEQRTQFIFTLFDDDRSGFLSMVSVDVAAAEDPLRTSLPTEIFNRTTYLQNRMQGPT